MVEGILRFAFGEECGADAEVAVGAVGFAFCGDGEGGEGVEFGFGEGEIDGGGGGGHGGMVRGLAVVPEGCVRSTKQEARSQICRPVRR